MSRQTDFNKKYQSRLHLLDECSLRAFDERMGRLFRRDCVFCDGRLLEGSTVVPGFLVCQKCWQLHTKLNEAIAEAAERYKQVPHLLRRAA